MREGIPGTPTQGEWLCKVLSSGSRVGVDPMLISFDQWQSLSSQLENCGNSLVPVAQNLIDLLWEERPSLPANAVFPLPVSFAGQTWQEKVIEVRKEMIKKQASVLVLTALDEIAWLLNLRGSDIEYSPVFFAYCVLTLDNLYLFVDEEKLIAETLKHLHLDASPTHEYSGPFIEQRPYKLILDFLKGSVSQQQGKIWISNQSSYSLDSLIPHSKRITDPNPVLIKKTIKNSVEIECIRQAHLKDAVALCEFFAWLEEEIAKSEITELSAAAKLEEFRKTQKEYIGQSFTTISASGPNAAVIHYTPTEKTNRRLTPNEIYLCDTGTQYRDGTTDVTRTVHFGTPSDYEKECYTRVVKGHINLASAIFPNLTKGQMLDSFARKPLWDVGLDYRHGTGHGVGMFLNVHEGPVGISLKYRSDDPGLQSGMILSNEPGFYEDRQFGIRIESLVLVTKADTKYNFGNKDYLKFETITLVPLQTKLLDPSLLTEEEIEWLDSYHQTCREVVGKALKEQGRT
ncbi:xaa-Pro aminopeptidase 1-like protein, partial [Dinothrombium tinctorium]